MRVRLPVAFAAAGLLGGCSLVSGYPGDTAKARALFEQGNFREAALAYESDARGGDELLYRLEAATAFQTGGDFEASRRALEAAERKVEEFDDRPKVSAEGTAEVLGAAFLNDTELPYDGSPYERVLLNVLQSVNYWMLGDRQGAMVEVRRALLRMRDAARTDPLPPEAPPEHVFAQYYSATLRELSGDVDNAYVDYKQIYERAPNLTRVRRDLLRIARATGRRDDAAAWERAFPGLEPSRSIATDRSAGKAEVVVLYFCGMAPQKRSWDLVVPTGTSVTRVSVPKYEPRPDPAAGVKLVVDGEATGKTEPIENLTAVVTADLDRRMPALIAKTVARATGRAVATETGSYLLSKSGNDLWAFLVSIVGGLFSALVEQADLRSWLTLPRTFQVERVVCDPGLHEVRLELLSPGDTLLASRDLGTIELRPNVAVPIYVRSIGTRLFAIAGAAATPSNLETPIPLPR